MAMRPPQPRTAQILRQAAAARVAGATWTEAARAAGCSRQSLQHYVARHAEYWREFLAEANEKSPKGTAYTPVPCPSEDYGLSADTRHRIARAAALLATGATHAEVTKALDLAPHTIRHWQKAYPIAWDRAMGQAIETARAIVAAARPTSYRLRNAGNFLKQLSAIERWDRRHGDEAPAAAPAELRPEMTLSEFYHAYARPVCLEPRGTRSRSLREYEMSLRVWGLYTGDPPLNRIDDRLAARFVTGLSERTDKRHGTKISPNTVRKHCVQIQYLLDRAGPRSRDNRQGAGLLADVVWLERPRPRPKPAVDSFTLEEIALWLDACESAAVPLLDGVAPAAWWRALILFIYNSALRIATVMQLEWSMIDGDWLNVPGSIYKGGWGKRFYLNRQAREAIEVLRGVADRPVGRRRKVRAGGDPPATADRLFPWPYQHQALYRHQKAMLAAAGIPPHRRFGFHGLRKATATELARSNPMVARMHLGQRTSRVLEEHYVNPAIVAGELDRLSQPTSRPAPGGKPR